MTITDFSASEQKQSAFLGAGANGRVFKLSSGAVIKMVVGRRSDEVEKEYRLMQQYQARADIQSLVFPVQDDTYRDGLVSGVAYAGYVLACEGDKITLPVSRTVKIQLADALHGLHACGVIHGDPRVDNALLLRGTLKWIDFRDSESVTAKVSRRRDVEILLRSLLPVGASLVDTSAEVEAYVNNPTAERLRAILLK